MAHLLDSHRTLTKHSLAFILDRAPVCSYRDLTVLTQRDSVPCLRRSLPTSLHADRPPTARRAPRQRAAELSAAQKRLARQCKVDGCANYTIDRGLCFRHGGGKTCSVERCERSAKACGLCWRHGGSVPCSVADCARGAKARGLCWSHGGGKRQRDALTHAGNPPQQLPSVPIPRFASHVASIPASHRGSPRLFL